MTDIRCLSQPNSLSFRSAIFRIQIRYFRNDSSWAAILQCQNTRVQSIFTESRHENIGSIVQESNPTPHVASEDSTMNQRHVYSSTRLSYIVTHLPISSRQRIDHVKPVSKVLTRTVDGKRPFRYNFPILNPRPKTSEVSRTISKGCMWGVRVTDPRT